MSSARDEPRRPEGGIRVLCVDDDEDARSMMSDFLEAEGYHVTTVGTATEALRMLRSQRFRLVVTDQMMPDETGSWLLTAAHSEGLLAPVRAVIVTANAKPEHIVRPPGTLVFQKPLDIDEFLASIRDMLRTERT